MSAAANSPASNVMQHSLQWHIDALPRAWADALQAPLAAPSTQALAAFLDARQAAGAVIYPSQPLRALHLMAPSDVRVVLLGQDPYHGPDQAQGLSFSVPTAMRRPPSLRNMFQEIATTLGGNPLHFDNDLTRWATQGVLLLNTVLTVEDGTAAAHANQGWEPITDAIIRKVADDATPKVFLLWGSHAQAKRALLPASSPHLVLQANHPSPLSATRPPRPFIGCDHFRLANAWLEERGLAPIDWVGAA